MPESQYSTRTHPPEQKLPGDRSMEREIDRMIRVDHAGEFGAARIYDGQLAVLKGQHSEHVIRSMANQEQKHLAHFENLIAKRGIRPTVLSPVWHVAGFALGVASAALGQQAAMACTEAVESVITEHYAQQINKLGPEETELKATLEEFRKDEVAHRDSALEHGAKDAPAYEPLGTVVRTGTRLAIWLSERI